jgi:hypothetical protein
MLVDGDDSLVNLSDIFTYYNKIHYDYDFTYGSCWSMVDNIPLISQPYPPEVKINKSYKDYRFNWIMPYTHLRTLKAKLLNSEPDNKFQDTDGKWFKAGGDNSTFYTAIENADSEKVYVVPDIVYNYNDASPLNDYKINRDEQTRAIKEITGSTINDTPKQDLTNSMSKSTPIQIKRRPIITPQKSSNEVKSTIPQIATQSHVISTSPKRILIAIPTNKNIEAQTFKSIYDLIIPDGYTVDFQYFWGYQVDQVRNLIAFWTLEHRYDYLFSVDSDIAFAPNTLEKLLAHDKDIVSGLYIQRIPGTHVIEVMRKNNLGGVTHVNFADIKDKGLVPIDSCGFGCALVKAEVFKAIPYPHFLYHSAINHANTISEDVHFCAQVRDKGFTLWADTSILCDHIGSWTFKIDISIPAN